MDRAPRRRPGNGGRYSLLALSINRYICISLYFHYRASLSGCGSPVKWRRPLIPRARKRVEWTEPRILATSEGERAAPVMAATAEAGPTQIDVMNLSRGTVIVLAILDCFTSQSSGLFDLGRPYE